jgi:cation transport regulator ChaC
MTGIEREHHMTLYFAYGSNLWREQMTRRCPDHREIGDGLLRGYRWIITTRGHASVVTSPGDVVQGRVYQLSAADEESLDRSEGVASGAYRKEMLPVEVDGRSCDCLVYVDPVVEEGVPREEYVERLGKGIVDAELPAAYVEHYLRRYLPS